MARARTPSALMGRVVAKESGVPVNGGGGSCRRKRRLEQPSATSDSGRAAANAHLRLSNDNDTGGFLNMSFATDSAGTYEIAGLPPGVFRLAPDSGQRDAIALQFSPPGKVSGVCARATLRKKHVDEIADELDAVIAERDAPIYPPRYNIAPSDTSWIVEARGDERVLVPATWGYPTRDRHLINVRGEQIASGSGFRDAFASRRCLVVTDGFYEWNRAKRPTWFHRPGDGLVLLAGLFQTSAGPPRFTVLTTRPNRLVAEVHDRMPVIVSAEAIDRWLGGNISDAARLFEPAAEEFLVATAVSTRVNSVKHDDPGCLAPAEPERQSSLF